MEQAIQLDLFSGKVVAPSPLEEVEELTPSQKAIEEAENFYFSKQFADCCKRCELRGLCDNDLCAKILD